MGESRRRSVLKTSQSAAPPARLNHLLAFLGKGGRHRTRTHDQSAADQGGRDMHKKTPRSVAAVAFSRRLRTARRLPSAGLVLYLLSKVVGAVKRPLIELGDAATLIVMISAIESQGAETRGLRDNRGHGVSICGVHQ